MAQDDGKSTGLLAMSLAALGVVYGDIGTSPLYAFRESFFGVVPLQATHDHVLGILSMIFWSLIIVISLKYMLVVMRADNHGEGGIIALVSLLRPRSARPGSGRAALVLLGLFGAALLFGDGTITPAISVLSAVEGLEIAAPSLDPFVVPITIVVLVALFSVQRRGTHAIGRVFGPVMLVWFSVLGLLGIAGVVREPAVLSALSPQHAAAFFAANGLDAVLVLGTVFLAVTGGETLYADMGHFGRRPIRLAWFGLALPALMLNYLGQGALVLSDPAEVSHPFYHLAPRWALWPLVGLATLATVIASQAVISGVFSLTRQAMQLGQLPRVRIVQTHGEEFGQIYIPVMNWLLMAATIALVIGFGSSAALASAYGVSIATDMVITTILTVFIARRWGWPAVLLWGAAALFLTVDLAFFTANLTKIPDGGWYPLLVGAVVFTVMVTWRTGRRLVAAQLGEQQLPLEELARLVEAEGIVRTPGTAVFMSRAEQTAPAILRHHIERNRALHEQVILFRVEVEEVPRLPAAERLQVTGLAPGWYRVVARYGFMQPINVPVALRLCATQGLPVEMESCTFYLAHESLMPSERPGMALWQDHLFAFLARNATPATSFYSLPSERIVEFGIRLRI